MGAQGGEYFFRFIEAQGAVADFLSTPPSDKEESIIYPGGLVFIKKTKNKNSPKNESSTINNKSLNS